MKAILYEKGGMPEKLVLREVARPEAQGNQVLVRIQAAAVNAADYRSMRMGIIPKSKIYGVDVAGTVEVAGKDARQFQPGDEVCGDISGCGSGSFAEYVSVPETVLARKPANLTFSQAAALPLSAVTAAQALQGDGGVKPGQKVLIYGAGGGVGTFAVQLARYFGADVTAVCSTRNAEIALSLGANRVIDYTREDALRSGQKYDRILAINGSRALNEYRSALAPGGVYVMVGGEIPQLVKSMLIGPFLSLGGKKMRTLAARPDVKDLEFVLQLAAEGKIRPVIDRCYSLEQTAEAMRYAGEGHARGKVMILPPGSTDQGI